MNLEELNLVELNAQEVQETEGGWLDWFINVGFPGWGWNGQESPYPPKGDPYWYS